MQNPMDPERWNAVQAAFGRAVELDRDGLEAYLDELAGKDQALADLVRQMLAEDERTARFLDGEAGAAVGLGPGDAGEGRRLGAYRLVRRLGSGGMGTVWLAERDDGAYKGTVAIKLVRIGFESDEALRRFKAERQILAALQHPNVARLLDGGTAEDGTPYLVMELVEGTTLDAYCDEHELSINERIRLFLEVCAAVQYAHTRLIVHRDLKPNNIMVSGEGTPKLLDFGIAKLLDATELGLTEAATRTGSRLLTPRYASPEQIRGQAITAATDVYSLGVLLYELLTGSLPYRSSGTTAAQIERAILEEEPMRPSLVVGEVDRSGGTGASAARMKRELSGDLDTILLTALRKTVDRRYTSVEAFARDLDRYLRGLPVEAQPDTWQYRTQKFVRRNRTGVGLAAGFVVLLAGSAVALGVQAARITRERDTAEQERAKAEQVSEFLVDVFEASDPNEAQGVELTAGEILSRGGARIQSELGAQPAVRAQVMDAIGRVYQTLGEYDSAEVFFLASRDLRIESFGQNHADYLKSLVHLGTLERERGNFDSAVVLQGLALEGRRQLHGERHPDVAESLSNLGLATRDAGDAAAAETLYVRSLDIRRALSDEPNEGLAVVLNNLSGVLDDRGARDSAIAMLEEVREIRSGTLGEDHLDYSIALNNLATAHENAGHYDLAEPLYRQALETRERLLSDEHPSVLNVRNNLGVLLIRTGRPAEAEPMLRAVIEARRGQPDKRFELAGELNNFGAVLVRIGRYEEAAASYTESLELFEEELGSMHPTLAYPLSGIGLANSRIAREDVAEDAFRRALEIRETALERPHPQIAFSLDLLGTYYLQRQLFSDAEPLLVAALEMRRELLDDDHPEYAKSLESMGRLWLGRGDPASAEPLLRDALRIREAKLDAASIDIAAARGHLGRALSELSRADEAEPLLTQSYESYRAALDPSDGAVRTAAELLATHYERIGDEARAREYRRAAEGSAP